MRLRQAINEQLHMNDRLIALVLRTGYLQVPDEQTELIDHLEAEKDRLRREMTWIEDLSTAQASWNGPV